MTPIKLYHDLSVPLYVGETRKKRATPKPPITYLTQWKIVGNSEVHGSEIWSCGEYSATDGKYHIVVQPLGKSPVDIALTEPLRKVNDVADTIEFPSTTEGKALVTRRLGSMDLGDCSWVHRSDVQQGLFSTTSISDRLITANVSLMCATYSRGLLYVNDIASAKNLSDYEYTPYYNQNLLTFTNVYFKNSSYNTATAFGNAVTGIEFIYELATPTTELIDAVQIEESAEYSMVISQGAKAVEWSSFTTESNSD